MNTSNTIINDYMENIIKIKGKKYQSEEISDLSEKRQSEETEEIEETESEILSKLEIEFENETVIKKQKLPENYGNKWTDEEKNQLIKLLKTKKDVLQEDKYSLTKYDVLSKIAKKLRRSEGGIICEIKKLVLIRYMSGEELEKICNDLNLVYKNTKMVLNILQRGHF